MAKAGLWTVPDAEARRPGEQTGLDTPVACSKRCTFGVGGDFDPFCAGANALNVPPGTVRSQD